MLTTRRLQFLAAMALAFLASIGIVYFAFPGLLFDLYRVWQRREGGFNRQTVEVEKWRIPYLDSASESDRQVVLLLHGFGDNKDNFIALAAGLTDEYRVVVPDLPGFGETAIRPDTEYSPELYVRTILGLLDRLGISSVDLVGYSMGGTLAVKIAAQSPHRVRSLTLLAPAGIRGDRRSKFDRMVDAGDDIPLVYRDRESFERLLRLNFNRLPKIPDFAVRAILAEGKRRADVFECVFEAMLADLETASFQQEIASLQMPVQIIMGDADQIVDRSAADRWQEIHPEIKVTTLPGASHALVHQRIETLRELLLSQLRPSSSHDFFDDVPVDVR